MSMTIELPYQDGAYYDAGYMDAFRTLLYDLVSEQRPMTVRQAYYRCVVKGYVNKTEKAYGVVQRQLAKLRTDGVMPYEWIIDASRHVRSGRGDSPPGGAKMNRPYEVGNGGAGCGPLHCCLGAPRR